MATLPDPLPNFSHIMRYWDAPRKHVIAKILPGQVYVTKSHEVITTTLGSCIAVCMRDPINKIGGMNHFKLPAADGRLRSSNDANYGRYAMDLLINEIMKNGGLRQNLECQVFGGGRVIPSIDSDIGDINIIFINQYLKEERLPVIHRDTGGASGIQVYFHPITGHTYSTRLDGSVTEKIRLEERRYMQQINDEIESSGITYF